MLEEEYSFLYFEKVNLIHSINIYSMSLLGSELRKKKKRWFHGVQSMLEGIHVDRLSTVTDTYTGL